MPLVGHATVTISELLMAGKDSFGYSTCVPDLGRCRTANVIAECSYIASVRIFKGADIGCFFCCRNDRWDLPFTQVHVCLKQARTPSITVLVWVSPDEAMVQPGCFGRCGHVLPHYYS